MSWVIACVLGAGGGAVAQLVHLWDDLARWQRRRRTARRRQRRVLRSMARELDFAAHGVLLVMRMSLGAVAGAALHTELTGSIAAMAVGASAPSLLAQWGRNRQLGFGQKPPDDEDPPQDNDDPAKDG